MLGYVKPIFFVFIAKGNSWLFTALPVILREEQKKNSIFVP